jgi:hypothetical protein
MNMQGQLYILVRLHEERAEKAAALHQGVGGIAAVGLPSVHIFESLSGSCWLSLS